MMILENAVVVVANDLTSADLGGEAVILDVNNGQYYGLNEVGAQILELIKEPTSVGVVVDALLEKYDANAEQLKEDVFSFLQALEDRGLIYISHEGSE